MVNNHIVTKSNSLIEARYKLTLDEQRLILYLVSMVQPHDEDFKVYTLSVKDFLSLINIKNQNVYTQFKIMAEHLMSKPLIIKKENSTLVMNWLSSAEYYSGQGKIEISFDPKLKPYLLKLKANFTSYKLKNVIMLKSFYSIRIYELLKQYERLNERTFTLQDLREYLSIEDDLYPMYSNFKQKVISVAYRELKEKSDIYFEYQEIKQNRKVDKLKFIIYKKVGETNGLLETDKDGTDTALSLEAQRDMDALKAILNLPLSDKELLSIYKAADGDMDLIENRYGEAKNKQQLNNLVGFMVWACKEPDQSFQKTAKRGKQNQLNPKRSKRDYQAIEKMERELLIREFNKQEERFPDEDIILL